MRTAEKLITETREAVKERGSIAYMWVLAEMLNDSTMQDILTDTDRKTMLRIIRKTERSHSTR